MRGKLVHELKLLVRVRGWVLVEFGTSSAFGGWVRVRVALTRALRARSVRKHLVTKGGLQPKKNRTLPQISNLGLVFFGFFLFFRFFSVFFGFSILANFDWFNGFLLSGSFC